MESKTIPNQEAFVEKYKREAGEKNAILVYKLLKDYGEFPDDFYGGSVNAFLDSINSYNMYNLLKEIKSNSKKQTIQFYVSIFLSLVAVIIAGLSFYFTIVKK